MLSSEPRLKAPGVPSASDVRAARELTIGLARAARANRPTIFIARSAQLQGAARVLTNAVPRLRIEPGLSDTGLTLVAAFELTASTWVNGEVRIMESPRRGYPAISARVGALPIPEALIEPLFAAAHSLAEWRADADFPTLRQAISGFEARPQQVTAVIDLPNGLFRRVSRLVPGDDAIDVRLTDHLYAVLMDRLESKRQVEIADVYATAFEDAPVEQTAARQHVRAAMVAVAMTTVGYRARRLAAGGEAIFRPRIPEVLNVRLAGRDDLAKHFALSAAIAAAADPSIGEALGTWKELDDSLPGGSGFSFVDLAADRAGLRFGEAAADARAPAIVQAFRSGEKPQLLPLEALGFDEGMSESEFSRRYGNIAADRYDAFVVRIDKALDTLPIMRR